MANQQTRKGDVSTIVSGFLLKEKLIMNPPKKSLKNDLAYLAILKTLFSEARNVMQYFTRCWKVVWFTKIIVFIIINKQ